MFAAWGRRKKIEQAGFHQLLGKAKDDEFVCIDCEMTGLDKRQDALLSIAAIHINGKRILSGSARQWVCKPPAMPTAETIRIHGLRPEDVANGISYAELFAEFLPFIGARTIVGYHIGLDKGFLDQQCQKTLGFSLPNRTLDIGHLFVKRQQRRSGNEHVDKRFATIMHELAIPTLSAHDAYHDALMTAMAFMVLR
ncbi:3'-5' exonuclease [Suttonella sp. R2A3]|uniref:3'-5' exonuclease n=1 Tax=Suttonella sp. R2A3 TaxID=2908648 RepID=UPI001F1B4E3F|nr:3'-5' exonuclease [Suttonella sp. R2A3]UJF25384.1 3'-5' exonuclease [Suttonella sp. R2A3]